MESPLFNSFNSFLVVPGGEKFQSWLPGQGSGGKALVSFLMVVSLVQLLTEPPDLHLTPPIMKSLIDLRLPTYLLLLPTYYPVISTTQSSLQPKMSDQDEIQILEVVELWESIW